GHAVQLDRNSRIQERSLGLEEAETMRATLRSQNQLEALLEDELQFEPVREEVFRELIELYDYETNHGLRVRDCARKGGETGECFKPLPSSDHNIRRIGRQVLA